MDAIIHALAAYVEPSAAMLLLLISFLMLGFCVVINSKNPIEWYHFVSSKSEDGHQYGDVNKVAILIAIVFSTGIVSWYAYYLRMEWWMFLFWLAFMGAVESYAKWLRSVLGKTSLTTTTVATAEVTTTTKAKK